ncbi:MAG: SusC/RagA family TonB-linked outer membrane protein [Cruoricaptor ignavus]|nr:SusC/RagA family TonB-linked outer membrane protein [Cruoricaptor ignavus]
MKKQVLSIGILGSFLFWGTEYNAQSSSDSLRTQKIDEVVVVAFGKQKAKAIVGSVSTVGKEVLSTQQNSNPLGAIQGSVSGVNIISSSTPGNPPVIRVRGIGSINANSDPLIIVDGAPYSGSISNISQEEIESMSVLKDGSATSLYGSRGANGVILITTKKGTRGKPRVTIQSSLGYSNLVNNIYPMIDNSQYLNYTWEALRNTAIDQGRSIADAGAFASGEVIPRLQYNPYNVATPIDANGNLVPGAQMLWNTDWAKEILNRSGQRQEALATISGGNDNTNYFLSINYLNQEGTVKSTNFERLSTRLNIESKVSKWLTVGLNTSFANNVRSLPPQSGGEFGAPIASIYNFSSVYPLYERDPNGNLILDSNGNPQYDFGGGSATVVNAQRPFQRNSSPMALLHYDRYHYKTNTLTLNGFVKVDIFPTLSFRSNYSYEQNTVNNHIYRNTLYGVYAPEGGRVSTDRDWTTTKNWINSLNYSENFGNHTVSADAIIESLDKTTDYNRATGTGLFPGIEVLSGTTVPYSVTGFIVPERLVGILGRASYNYSEKYFVEGSFRRDGSSVFSSETRWGNFFSVGGAYIVSEENFLKGNNTISFLKLKSSYGELGNNNLRSASIPDNVFPYLATYLTGYNVGNNIGIILSTPKDRLLTWEKTASFNAGFELGLFKNRINLTADYYEKKSVDLIGPLVTAGSTGATSITSNIGKLKNYGYEFGINSRNIRTANWRWDTNLNFSFDRNKILALSEDNTPQTQGTKRWEVGRSLYDFYIPNYAGVNPDNGKPLWYKDVVNSDGTTSRVTTESYSEATRYFTKSSLPKVIGGLNNFVKFKNFDLNALINFSFGSYIYDNDYANLMRGTFTGISAHADLERRWQNPGDITDVPRLNTISQEETQLSDRFLFKNDYVRLKAITIGYNFSRENSEKIGLRNVRLFLQGDNLFTWQTLKNQDPEQDLSGITNLRSFNVKTLSFGVKLDF